MKTEEEIREEITTLRRWQEFYVKQGKAEEAGGHPNHARMYFDLAHVSCRERIALEWVLETYTEDCRDNRVQSGK